ncbi:MAG: hypothetical protein GXO80_03440 [Chlorobi bacterium]|nr:hypothetical protein [Chlorobiota bacterium]
MKTTKHNSLIYELIKRKIIYKILFFAVSILIFIWSIGYIAGYIWGIIENIQKQTLLIVLH